MSGKAEWLAVEDWFSSHLLPEAADLAAVLAANAKAGLPAIDVSPAQGKFLSLLVRMTGARHVLEIGTLGGYSTIWMARALPEGGRIVTLEADPHHAATARANLSAAGVERLVDLREGKAADTLPSLSAEAPFDLFFIDADKPSNPLYISWALRLARPGSVIVLDNVVRNGAVTDGASRDASVVGTRKAVEALGADLRIDATVLQTVGTKGWDGLVIGVVRRI